MSDAPFTAPLPVLVVDDDEQQLRTLADILRRYGYAPHGASTGRCGLELMRNELPAPAIALIDLKLPDMDGMEVVGEVRRRSPATEVVVLTGHASVESAVGALRQQSYDYLIKPVAPDRLVDTLARAGDRWLRRAAEDALRQGEERFRRLIEGIGDVVFLLDADLTVDYVTPSVQRVLGVAPGDVTGRPVTGLFASADGADASALVRRLLMHDPGTPFEVRARHRGGEVRLLQATVSGAPGGGTVLTARDVTEQRRLERQALQAHRLDSIGRLAGGIAHDFNNLLTVIVGACDLALDEMEGPARERLRDIQLAADRAARLTRQLLQFARREPGEPRVFALNDLTRDLDPLLRRVLGAHVEVEQVLAEQPVRVLADPAQIEQVIVNLAINGRDAMPGGGRLTMRVDRVDLEGEIARRHPGMSRGGYARLIVEDSGVGMDEDVRARACEPFFTTKDVGSGLGLAICYGIVRQAQGSIVLESAPGRGTRVEVILPLASEPGVAGADAELHAALPRGSETILLVEDDAAVRGTTMLLLGRLGYRVVAARTGAEALDLLARAPDDFDLLMADIAMAQVSRPQVVAAARALRPDLGVLYLSGYHAGTERSARAATADPLLAKPFTATALAHAVREALAARRA